MTEPSAPRDGAAPPAISVRDLSKVYRVRRGEAVTALDGVDLDVADGEFVSVVGPSGCGKSTLMMTIAGLRGRTSGAVEVDGHDVTGPVTEAGIVFQRDVLLDWRTALDNVMLQVQMRGLPKAEYRERALELLRSAGLEGFEDRHPWELSGGMRQRVAICRALVHDPRILLMDEPFGALDALTREDMAMQLQRLWLARRKSVVFITHSISEAVFLSDRVVVMTPRPGRIERVLEVPIERPRRFESMSTPEFGALVNEIRDIFRARGVISGDG